MKVLIIDDSPTFVAGLVQLLTERRFRPIGVGSWTQVVSALQQHQPDVIVLDINLENLTGDVVARSVRAFYRGPILFVSSEPEARLKAISVSVGRADYLQKSPMLRQLLPQKLLAMVRSAAPGVPEPRPSGAHKKAERPLGHAHKQPERPGMATRREDRQGKG